VSTIKLPQLPWHGTKELELPLPEGWEVEMYHMAGYNRPALKPAQIKAAIAKPIGMSPLREYARGKKEVVIIFDDMTRVTRLAEIVPFVLEELAEAGISDDRIRFIMALGTHGVANRLDFEKKLGRDVVARFPVYNHNAFNNCVYVGTTSYGTAVSVNAEVMSCDLKLGIGSVVPHPNTGFGGGGKLILPGVCSAETAESFHRLESKLREKNPGKRLTGMGVFDDNPMQLNVAEAAAMVGLDMKLDCLLDGWGESAAIFAGALKPAYEAATRAAKTHYLTPEAKDKRIVIANTFAKANEAAIVGLNAAFNAISPEGGDVVLVGNAPDGQVIHYLLGSFGKTSGGNLRLRVRVPRRVNRLIVYSEYPEAVMRDYFQDLDKVLFISRWDDVVKALQESHGNKVKVTVFPSADIQYFPGASEKHSGLF